jgi:hypothetical protein
MQKYHVINRLRITKTLTVLNELSEKFPKMTLNNIDFYSLAPYYHLQAKDFFTMVVFLDGIRNLKAMDRAQNKLVSFVIDMSEVKSITAKKEESKWVFDLIYGKDKRKLSFETSFTF